MSTDFVQRINAQNVGEVMPAGSRGAGQYAGTTYDDSVSLTHPPTWEVPSPPERAPE